MVRFTFQGIKLFLVIGIAELALGVFLIIGIIRGRSGLIVRIFGGALLIAGGIVFMGLKNFGEIRISDGSMHLSVPFQRDKLITTEEIVGVCEVNIATMKEFRPVKKISGGAVGDIRTGWFRLSNGEKAFLALDGVRALHIETTHGYSLLVGHSMFEEFEKAFRDYIYRP